MDEREELIEKIACLLKESVSLDTVTSWAAKRSKQLEGGGLEELHELANHLSMAKRLKGESGVLGKSARSWASQVGEGFSGKDKMGEKIKAARSEIKFLKSDLMNP